MLQPLELHGLLACLGTGWTERPEVSESACETAQVCVNEELDLALLVKKLRLQIRELEALPRPRLPARAPARGGAPQTRTRPNYKPAPARMRAGRRN